MNNITKFATFYSYKGGVGRTSSLVNTAILRANEGNKVVVIDFDLEAPGADSYFSQLDLTYSGNRPGILDYLIEAIEGDVIPPIKQFAYDLSSKIDRSNGGELWIISAGEVNSSSYHSKLERLKWTEIFQNHNGELIIKNLKKQIQLEFDHPDYVFVDSRTGITETGGICTRYLADLVVMMTSLNEQNILGTSKIYKDLKNENLKFLMIASNIPVGFPLDEDQVFGKRIDTFQKAFGREPDVCIYNYPSLSLNEILPVISSQSHRKSKLFRAIYHNDPLIRSYKDLARKIEVVFRSDNSYLSTIKYISRRMHFIDKDNGHYLRLTSVFSGRYLGDLSIRLFDFSKLTAMQLTPLKCEEFLLLNERIKSTSNSELKQALEFTKQKLWILVKNHIRGNQAAMTKFWEIFVSEEDELLDQALYDISNGCFVWATEYLLRKFNQVDKSKNYEVALYSFNLATCLDKAGDPQALKYYGIFCENVKDTIREKSLSEDKANNYFCMGIALKKLGMHLEASDVLKLSREFALNSKGNIFSPISYKTVSQELFLDHLYLFENSEYVHGTIS